MFVKSGTINTGNITIGEKVENAVAIQTQRQFVLVQSTLPGTALLSINGTGSAQNIGLMGVTVQKDW